MKLNEIKLKALKETNKETGMFDIVVSYHLIDYIEGILDSIGIPCYQVNDTCLSIAGSYKTLEEKERQRA